MSKFKISRILILAVIALQWIPPLSAKTKKQPNVIVIITDDQGYGDMSCHGNPYLQTPALDQLHDEGVRLTDFHVDPTCAPTRAALMTGRYSARVGVWLTYGSRHHLRRDETTMADVFKQNGYKTAIFGKWHLGDNYPFRPMDRGFDESLIHGGGVVGETPDYWDNNYYDDTYFRNGKPDKVKGYCTDVWFNETIRFVEDNKERPFFVYLSTNAPHGPLHVHEKYRKPFLNNPETKPRAEFYGMIVNIDENIKRLRDYLKEQSLDRETIIVFLNDNGTNKGAVLEGPGEKGNRNGWEKAGYNAGMRGIKTSRYEGGHRAACFIYYPNGNLTGGRDVNGVTANIDLMPTLVDLCDLKYKPQLPFDGVSLAKALSKNNAKAPQRTVVVHDQGRFNTPLGEGLLLKDKDYSVMDGKWRLVGKELFDLSKDPGQRNDISREYPEVAKKLRKKYEIWWDDISERGGEYNPFVINPKKQKVVTISAQNLLGGDVAYSQKMVRMAKPSSGWTVIDVEVPGTYQISLSRWAREANLAINGVAPPYPMHPSTHYGKPGKNVSIGAKTARLKVAGFDKTVPVNDTDKEIVFEVKLSKGEHRIQTWFYRKNEKPVAAYFTYIERN